VLNAPFVLRNSPQYRPIIPPFSSGQPGPAPASGPGHHAPPHYRRANYPRKPYIGLLKYPFREANIYYVGNFTINSSPLGRGNLSPRLYAKSLAPFFFPPAKLCILIACYNFAEIPHTMNLIVCRLMIQGECFIRFDLVMHSPFVCKMMGIDGAGFSLKLFPHHWRMRRFQTLPAAFTARRKSKGLSVLGICTVKNKLCCAAPSRVFPSPVQACALPRSNLCG